MAKPTTASQEIHLTNLDARLVTLETTMQSIKETQDYHNKILVRGNGSPSLVEEVHTVVKFMNDFRDNYKYWSRWIIAGILANIIGFTSAAILWFVRIGPVLEKIVNAYPHP